MHPVARSNSNVDVGKNSFNGGQVNSILPLWVMHLTLSLIKVLTCVFLKSGTYQSRPIPPWRWMYSSMSMSSFCGFLPQGSLLGHVQFLLYLVLFFGLPLDCWPCSVVLHSPCTVLLSWLWFECQLHPQLPLLL